MMTQEEIDSLIGRQVLLMPEMAYYSYREFCHVRGIKPMELEAWREADYKLFTESTLRQGL